MDRSGLGGAKGATENQSTAAPSSPPLRLLDEHGEIHESCPGCIEWEQTYRELERKYRGALSQIGNLRADKDAEAQAHQSWDKAVAVFWEWKIATGRMRSRWSADRFWLVHPYLRDDGMAFCRAAVWGIAAHPNRKEVTPDYFEVFNDFELCFRSRAHAERYARRGWAIFGNDLPGGPIDA
jgi:hypothetical protein